MRIAIALLPLFPLTASACIWDYDTLRQERARFPETLELITGKFLRHSPEFYEWRVKDRIDKLRYHPSNLDYYDDLAVAYHKTGRHDLAVEVMLKKERIAPGKYTTYSNLGTFYILNGELEKGLPYIDKALAIDPEAHFGRERYQKWLVEYAISRKKGGKLEFPLALSEDDNFQTYLAAKRGVSRLNVEDTRMAVKAILGMMRFANHNNPLLLEALGDLLHLAHNEKDAKQLAARAYLQASLVTKGATSGAYRGMAREVLRFQVTPKGSTLGGGPEQLEKLLTGVEEEFREQRAEAEGWYASLREKELGWIEAGLDADKEFDKLYTEAPELADAPTNEDADPLPPRNWLLMGGSIAVIVVLAGAGALLLWRRRK